MHTYVQMHAHRKLMITIIVIMISLCCPEASDDTGQKIAGGIKAKLGDFPYAIFLNSTRGTDGFMCSGSLLHPQWVMTAAHCCSEGMTTYAMAGYTGGGNLTHAQVRQAVKYIQYPGSKTVLTLRSVILHRDYCLIKVDRSFDIDNITVGILEVESIPWPGRSRTCKAIGYGVRSSGDYGELHSVDMEFFHGKGACACYRKSYQIKKFICHSVGAAGSAICSGDSGGPLVCNNRLVGVASFMFPEDKCNLFATDRVVAKCGGARVTIVHVYVCPVLDWIRNYVGDHIPQQPDSCTS